jgi:hypothetical protein
VASTGQGNPLSGLIRLVAQVFNQAVTANVNIFAKSFAQKYPNSLFEIYVCFDTGGGTLSVMRTVGSTTVAEQLNAANGFALQANGAYAFRVPVDAGETINLQYSVSANALKISMRELASET